MRALILLLIVGIGFSLVADDRVTTIDTVRQEIHERATNMAELQSRIRLFQSRVDVLTAKVNASEGMTRCLAVQDLRFWQERLLAERLKLNRHDAALAPYALQLERVLRSSLRLPLRLPLLLLLLLLPPLRGDVGRVRDEIQRDVLLLPLQAPHIFEVPEKLYIIKFKFSVSYGVIS